MSGAFLRSGNVEITIHADGSGHIKIDLASEQTAHLELSAAELTDLARLCAVILA